MNKERLSSKVMKKEIRLLEADEIECRVATINEKGVSLLLFKDARVDQKILDETFTPFGWSRSHQNIEGNLYCTVEIWDEDKQQWVGKQDVGTMSYSEKEKGQASSPSRSRKDAAASASRAFLQALPYTRRHAERWYTQRGVTGRS